MNATTSAQKQIEVPSRLLTGPQVAEILGVSLRQVAYLRERRVIRFVPLGHLIRFDPAQLREDLALLTVQRRSQ